MLVPHVHDLHPICFDASGKTFKKNEIMGILKEKYFHFVLNFPSICTVKSRDYLGIMIKKKHCDCGILGSHGDKYIYVIMVLLLNGTRVVEDVTRQSRVYISYI